MSAYRKQSKKVSQDELRRLMNKHKEKLGDSVKKIDSPLAKYTNDGKLVCVLCDTVVRSENVWNVHVNAKAHRENVELMKEKKLAPPSSAQSNTLKRPADISSQEFVPPKKIKGILKNANPATVGSALPSDFFETKPGIKPVNSTQIKPGIVQYNFEDDEEEQDKETKEHASIKHYETIPEGFFDDPVKDAKARNVEYKDPIEEEWEKFQKEIKEEVTVSSQIIEEDHEEATSKRQIEEIDEQLYNWNRVLELERKKEAVKAAERRMMEVDEEHSSGDESDFDEFLDWRAKKSYT